MTTRAPDYLVARLKTVSAHVRHLARERGLQDAFLGELALFDSSVRRALEAASVKAVEAALQEARALALRLAGTRTVLDRLAEFGQVPAREGPSTLLAPAEPAGLEPSDTERQPSEDAVAARDSLLP